MTKEPDRLFSADRTAEGRVTVIEFEVRRDGTLYVHDEIELPAEKGRAAAFVTTGKARNT